MALFYKKYGNFTKNKKLWISRTNKRIIQVIAYIGATMIFNLKIY